MKRVISIAFAVMLMSGCATPLKFGKNATLRYNRNMLGQYMILNQNGTFVYHLRFGEAFINGNWSVH